MPGVKSTRNANTIMRALEMRMKSPGFLSLYIGQIQELCTVECGPYVVRGCCSAILPAQAPEFHVHYTYLTLHCMHSEISAPDFSFPFHHLRTIAKVRFSIFNYKTGWQKPSNYQNRTNSALTVIFECGFIFFKNIKENKISSKKLKLINFKLKNMKLVPIFFKKIQPIYYCSIWILLIQK